MLRRIDPSIEASETPVIVCNHELKPESDFIFWCSFER